MEREREREEGREKEREIRHSCVRYTDVTTLKCIFKNQIY